MIVGCWLIKNGLREFGLRQRVDLFRGQPKDANCAGDIFYCLLPQVGEGERQLVPDLIIRRARDAYAAGLAERLQAGGNIDAIPEDIVAVYNDVPHIDPDAKHDAPVLSHARIPADHTTLHYDGAPDRIDDTGKLDQRAVACGLDDTAMMSGDYWVKQLAPMSFKRI
ncbi:MAG TPA: hypothetical protein VIY68_15085 [Steroidobacteraceae bacterium]